MNFFWLLAEEASNLTNGLCGIARMILDAAYRITDLKAPPGNQLEILKNDLLGYHSVRVNDQWRVIFKWPSTAQGPSEVDVVDYH